MRVLHYIRDFSSNAGDTATIVKTMLASTSKVAENHLLTTTKLADEYKNMLYEKYGISVYVIESPVRRNPLTFFTLGGKVKQMVKQVKPDLVHVHGSWDYVGAVVEYKSRKQGIVTIVSPHGGLSSDMLNSSLWSYRMPRLAVYQAWMIRNCISVLALSKKESDDVKSTRLKQRVEILPPISKDGYMQEPLSDALMAAYRKAVDSSYQKYITKEEKTFVHEAVRAAIMADATDLSPLDTQGLSFRRMYFYAYDEDAMQLLIDGTKKLNIPIPPVFNVDNVPRYVNKKAKQRCSLADVSMQHKKSSIPAEKINENKAVALIAAAAKIGRKKLTLRNWAELYELFRNTDFDEDIVAKELTHQRLKSFTEKIQKTLGKYYDLPRGFDIY